MVWEAFVYGEFISNMTFQIHVYAWYRYCFFQSDWTSTCNWLTIQVNLTIFSLTSYTTENYIEGERTCPTEIFNNLLSLTYFSILCCDNLVNDNYQKLNTLYHVTKSVITLHTSNIMHRSWNKNLINLSPHTFKNF